MKRPCFCVRRWRILLGLVLVPPLFWSAILTLLPTQFVRDKIAATLSTTSGRVVKIGALHVGFLGDVHLEDLRIGAPTSGDNPWLSVRSAMIDQHLLPLVFGAIEPTQIEVDGMELRILRRVDGSIELADFLNPADPRRVSSSLDEPHGRHSVMLTLKDAKIVVLDDPTRTRFAFENVTGHVSCDGIVTTLSDLRGTLNAGTIQLAGQFDRSGTLPKFEGQIRAREVVIGEEMGALGYFLPLLPGHNEHHSGKFEGRLALDFYVEGEGNSREALRKTLKGHGRIDVDPIALEGSATLNALARLLQVPLRERFGAARADLALKQGRMTSENLTINVAKIPLTFSGWTDMDGVVNYRLKADAISERIPRETLQFLNEMDITISELANIQVRGTVDTPNILVDDQPLVDSKNGNDEGRRVREIGRRIRDRVRR